MGKKPIIIFCAYYLPGYKAGGPIRSIANIVESLSDEYDFYIVTKDRDSFDQNCYTGIFVDQWNKVGKAHVFYTSPKFSYRQIKNLLNERTYHRLYLNSFFSIRFSFIPFLLNYFNKGKVIKTILAPRGEFSEGALELKSFKKRLFIKTISFFNLYKDVIWQASSKYEEEDIKNIMHSCKINSLIAPNLPRIFNDVDYENQFFETLKIVYVSRISPKKNLIFALDTLKKIKFNVEFSVFGVIDDNSYWKKCEQIIETLPSNIKVIYCGSIPNDQVFSILSRSHLFFLPTKGENYGHAIVEAFMAGIPVLISDTTPWRDLEVQGVGWDIPLRDTIKYVNVIEFLYNNLSRGKFCDKKFIQKWIKNKIGFNEVVELNKKLFK